MLLRANVNAKDDEGSTALKLAAMKGHTSVVRVLLEKGADPDLKNNYGHTPLMSATWSNHTEIMELLKRKGAKPFSIPESSETGYVVTWDKLSGCDFIRERTLNNRIRVIPGLTEPLFPANAMEIADGVVRGGPYDALGIGTYVLFDSGDWIDLCGLTFKNGSFTIVKEGFKFDPKTTFKTPLK